MRRFPTRRGAGWLRRRAAAGVAAVALVVGASPAGAADPRAARPPAAPAGAIAAVRSAGDLAQPGVAPVRLILEPTPEAVARLLEGGVDPAQVDFGSWRFGAEAGQAAFRQLAEGLRTGVQADLTAARNDRSLPPDARVAGCLSSKWLALQAWSAIAARASDAGAYHARREALSAQLTAFRSQRAAASTDAAPHLAMLQRWTDARRRAATPVRAELFARVAAAQFNRLAPQPAAVPADATADWAGLRALETCLTDTDNTAWLIAQVDRLGWFERAPGDEDADLAALLIVQAADHEPAWQMRRLRALETLAMQQRSDPEGVAQLADRLDITAARAQRYGTQGRCVAGAWSPQPIADPANLDGRRAALGLAVFSDHVAAATARCPRPAIANAAPKLEPNLEPNLEPSLGPSLGASPAPSPASGPVSGPAPVTAAPAAAAHDGSP